MNLLRPRKSNHCPYPCNKVLETEARKVMEEMGVEITYKFVTMIEIPRVALTADKMAEHAELFSFGTNDLTQTTYATSRDDVESRFLIEYMIHCILPDNPFKTINPDELGELMRIVVEKERATNPDIKLGICGEHGGEEKSIVL